MRKTKLELAEALGTSRSSVDRLIAAGLQPVGHRGRAKVYSLAVAKRLQKQIAGSITTEHGGSLLELFDAQTQEAVDRLQELRTKYVDPQEWKRDWRAYELSIKRSMASWPERIASELEMK